MSCPKCEAGPEAHKEQIKRFPVGTKVIAKLDLSAYDHAGSIGEVTGHCDDGRACFKFKTSHTFHYPDGYIEIASKAYLNRRARVIAKENQIKAAQEAVDSVEPCFLEAKKEYERLRDLRGRLKGELAEHQSEYARMAATSPIKEKENQ